jgi:hypothetical protein
MIKIILAQNIDSNPVSNLKSFYCCFRLSVRLVQIDKHNKCIFQQDCQI